MEYLEKINWTKHMSRMENLPSLPWASLINRLAPWVQSCCTHASGVSGEWRGSKEKTLSLTDTTWATSCTSAPFTTVQYLKFISADNVDSASIIPNGWVKRISTSSPIIRLGCAAWVNNSSDSGNAAIKFSWERKPWRSVSFVAHQIHELCQSLNGLYQS